MVGPGEHRTTERLRPVLDADTRPSRNAASQRRAMQAAMAAAIMAMRSTRGRSPGGQPPPDSSV